MKSGSTRLAGISDSTQYFDELYHANDDGSGDPEGYDKLNRLTDLRRGELSNVHGTLDRRLPGGAHPVGQEIGTALKFNNSELSQELSRYSIPAGVYAAYSVARSSESN